MADIVRPEFSAPPESPEGLAAELRVLHAKLSKMPELMITWDISDGQNLPGKQAAATTSQIMASLTNMIEGVEVFIADNPGQPIANADFPDLFWVMHILAREGVRKYEEG